jgi:hypothetical protein
MMLMMMQPLLSSSCQPPAIPGTPQPTVLPAWPSGCHSPSMLALNPTPSSFEPLRRMAPTRWPSVKGSMPGGTRWKALSGQLAKKLSRALLEMVVLGLQDMM